MSKGLQSTLSKTFLHPILPQLLTPAKAWPSTATHFAPSPSMWACVDPTIGVPRLTILNSSQRLRRHCVKWARRLDWTNRAHMSASELNLLMPPNIRSCIRTTLDSPSDNRLSPIDACCRFSHHAATCLFCSFKILRRPHSPVTTGWVQRTCLDPSSQWFGHPVQCLVRHLSAQFIRTCSSPDCALHATRLQKSKPRFSQSCISLYMGCDFNTLQLDRSGTPCQNSDWNPPDITKALHPLETTCWSVVLLCKRTMSTTLRAQKRKTWWDPYYSTLHTHLHEAVSHGLAGSRSISTQPATIYPARWGADVDSETSQSYSSMWHPIILRNHLQPLTCLNKSAHVSDAHQLQSWTDTYKEHTSAAKSNNTPSACQNPTSVATCAVWHGCYSDWSHTFESLPGVAQSTLQSCVTPFPLHMHLWQKARRISQ